MKRLIFAMCLLGGAVGFAQDKPAPAPYTEIESLKIQNVNLEGAIVQRAVEDWRKKVASLKAELEKARPGFVWNPEDGSWSAAGEKK